MNGRGDWNGVGVRVAVWVVGGGGVLTGTGSEGRGALPAPRIPVCQPYLCRFREYGPMSLLLPHNASVVGNPPSPILPSLTDTPATH